MRVGRSIPGRRFLIGVLALGLAAAVPTTRSVAQARISQEPGPTIQVIVQARNTAAAAAAVHSAGGTVTRDLGIVRGVAAAVPAATLAELAASRSVRAVTPDATMSVQSIQPSAAAAAAPLPTSVYGAEVRKGPAYGTGARGQGVTVALLDTGISASPDLAGRIVTVKDDLTGQTAPCENLSGESTCADSYGHGTFMAGLIAGNGASSNGRYGGIAPAAKLVSIKVASRDGSADVSNVLAGIQWAVSFRDRYHIRVLNLSLGTDATQSWKSDPLNYAVERAWAAGIAVVVAASNRGPAAGTISKPADDPWVITAASVDDRQTTQVSDDLLPDFSSRGPAQGVAKPDLAAPGAHLISLRAVGSTIDQQFPTYVAGAYHAGSGTSMAAAVVSGVSALVLSTRPTMTPDRLKYSLKSTTRAAAMTDPAGVGTGVVDAFAALNAPPGVANRGLDRSSGMGSLALSRGSVRVATSDPLQTVLSGLLTAQLLLWDPAGFVADDWTADTWDTTVFYKGRWYPTRWYGEQWTGHNWEGCTDDEGHDDCPYGHNWEGSAWYGAWG